MSEKAVVVYSGGMDSFTLLHRVHQHEFETFALSFNYGQRHVVELEFAASVCKDLGVNHKVVDISSVNSLIGGSSLTSDIDVPEGHYEEESMKATVVPNRNMTLLSLAVGYAVSIKSNKVFYGAHSGDHAIYPDCRPEFVSRMNDVCKVANYEEVEIVTPYLDQSKIEILADGLAMRLDYQNTWTCYNGREKPCGKCGACQERLEAFAQNGVDDPLEYESR